MKFVLESKAYKAKSQDCLIIGIYEEGGFTDSAHNLDKASAGYLKTWLKKGDFKGKIGQTFLLYHIPHLKNDRVLLVGCGKKQPLNDRDYRTILNNSFKALLELQVDAAVSFLTELEVAKRDLTWQIKQIVSVATHALYVFDEYKTKKTPQRSLEKLILPIQTKKTIPGLRNRLKTSFIDRRWGGAHKEFSQPS